MKRVFDKILYISLLGALLGSSGCRQGGRGNASLSENETGSSERIHWVSSFEEAVRTARDTGRPIMIDFFATWCVPCQVLDKKTYAHPLVVSAAREWISVKIDADLHPNLAAKYTVEGFPTIVFLGPDGKELGRFLGFVSAQEMSDRLQALRATTTATRDNTAAR